MAKFSYQMPTDFLDQLSRLEERTDEVIPKVLEAGGEVVLGAVRGNLRSVLSGKSTGELERSLGLSPAKMDRDGKRNAMLAAILEYGKHNQPPRPFLKPAKSASRAPAIAAMKRKLEKELGNV